MILLAEVDYPLLNLFWTTMVVFGWVLWIWLLIRVYSDVFRRQDIGAGAKTGWVVLTIFLPLIGTFIYLITQGRSMEERAEREAARQRQAFEEYVRSVARDTGGVGQDELGRAKSLLESGAINQREYEVLTAKVRG
jgi:hypothetical protein